jgi:nucleoid-associated protein YgaU
MALSPPKDKKLADFGADPSIPEISNPNLRSTKVRGNQRLLTITELQRTDSPNGIDFVPSGVEFKFSKENFSAPRGPQSFQLQLRTSRQDLPGSEEPVEQVLGWNYNPFTVTGVWDDRYAGTGYAEQTRRDFEDMVKRGNLIKYQFEQLSIRGLITSFQVNWKRADLIGYSFTISPHYRYKGETVRVDANKAVKVTMDPKTAVAKARQALELLKADQDLAGIRANARVQQLLKSTAFSDINAGLDTIESGVSRAENTVQNEILKPGQDAANALNRGAQAMSSVKTAVSSLLSTSRNIVASVHMSTSSLVENLKFESWSRSISANALLLAGVADDSATQMALRAQPKPKRLHRVRGGESLYQISTMYYGTPFHWRDILFANNLTSIVLNGGELLTIPDIKLQQS